MPMDNNNNAAPAAANSNSGFSEVLPPTFAFSHFFAFFVAFILVSTPSHSESPRKCFLLDRQQFQTVLDHQTTHLHQKSRDFAILHTCPLDFRVRALDITSKTSTIQYTTISNPPGPLRLVSHCLIHQFRVFDPHPPTLDHTHLFGRRFYTQKAFLIDRNPF